MRLLPRKDREGGVVACVPQGEMETLDCPKDLVGRVIGRKGETINELQAKAGVRIQIDQTVPDGQPCKIVISGDPNAVRLAVPMVHEVMAHGECFTMR